MNRNIFLLKYLQKQLNSATRKYSLKSDGILSVKYMDGIKTLTMTDQQTRNALSIKMMKNLIENITMDNDNPELRVIVISAEGKVFSAGHNLKELSPLTEKSIHEEVFKIGSELMDAIIDCPVPVIAKVNGVAAAAGCQLVAQCDLAICSESSSFLTPGVNFGIFCSTPGVALARSVSKSTAMKMLLTGKAISALEAKNSGLVADISKVENLDQTVEVYCEDIKMKSREVIKLGKQFYYKQLNLGAKQAYRIGGNIMVKNLQLPDGKEGINSFIEKRKASWTHGMK
ncbi:hypothetical protein HHI36_014491 [Cryptolaemus montrouzieri]|uniref:Enoyl-CoA hydratase domain-containing protein 3, mitochondrial n=1 Tax=Cryptolaemus montrouzieri TaxID=559131 RepID=A0ABD2N3P7_9CUCU